MTGLFWSMIPHLTDPGLCATCVHAQKIVSGRGNVFWLCRKGLVDSEFPKYPRLPVLNCHGFAESLMKRAADVESEGGSDEEGTAS